MATSLEERGPKIPGVQFKEPGMVVKMHLVDRQVTEYRQFTGDGTPGPIAKREDGTPKKQLVLTGIAAELKPGETPAHADNQPIQPGQLVRVYIKGSAYGQHIEQARNTFPATEVGDRFAQKFEREEKGRGAQPKKIYTFGHRRPNMDSPAEADMVARCEAKRIELQQRTSLEDERPLTAVSAPSGVSASDLLD